MDLGLLRRSRVRYWVWMLAPVAVAVLVHVGTVLYARHATAGLSQRQAMAAALPELAQALDRANGCLGRFPGLSVGAAAARGALSTQVTETAQRHGVVINSLRVGNPETGGVTGSLPVQVDGEGPLSAVLRFLDGLSRPDVLFSVESVAVKISRFSPVPIYSCEVQLRSLFRSQEG